MPRRGTIYLLHIEQPLHHAAHYLGWTKAKNADGRVAEHLRGQGSPLVRAALEAGSTVVLARTWERMTRDEERALKNRHNARGLCPRCRADYNEKARERMRRYRLERASHPR